MSMNKGEAKSECCRPKQDVVVEPIAGRYILGEGPHWDSRSQKLYFVDIYSQKVLRWSYKDESITSAYVEPGPVSFVLPVKDAPGKFAISCGNKFAIMTWDDDQSCENVPLEVLATVDSERDDNRWNDGKVDSSGRFYGGTMASEKDGIFKPEQGYLYCVGEDAVPKKLQSAIGISNGMAWSLEDDTFYYIDSLKYQVEAYDYDRQTGKIDNKRVVYDLKKNNIEGLPDGMTIDSDGNLWIAVYFGSCVLKVNPKTGKLLQTIKFPAKRITSVAFGGPQLDILYVTSSAFRMSEAELKDEPLAGYLFRVKGLGVRGLPSNEYKLNKK